MMPRTPHPLSGIEENHGLVCFPANGTGEVHIGNLFLSAKNWMFQQEQGRTLESKSKDHNERSYSLVALLKKHH